MQASEIVVLAVAGVLVLLLCCCCVFGPRNGRSPKEKRSGQAASSRVNRCFRLTTYVPVLVIFRRASSVLDPCGLSSRRYLNKNSRRVISTASALRSDRVLDQLRKFFGTAQPTPSAVNLDPKQLAA
jgi:hypothetical protein